MINRRLRCILFMTLFATLAASASAEPVLVRQGTEQGAGQTFIKGTTCYLVTAEHVVPEDESISVMDSRRVTANAEVVLRGSGIDSASNAGEDTQFNRLDVAVAKLEASNIACTTKWEDGEEIDDLLKSANALASPMNTVQVSMDGSISQQHLLLRQTGEQKLKLAGATAQDQYAPGASGTFVVQVDGNKRRFVGMIVRVETADGMVLALPQRWLNALVGNEVSEPSQIMSRPGTDTNYAGSDYRFFVPDSVEACAAACRDEARCRAYSYTEPGTQSVKPTCWLKNGVPQMSHEARVTSGMKLKLDGVDEAEALARSANINSNRMQGEWIDSGFPSITSRFNGSNGMYSFTRGGEFPGNPMHFDSKASATFDGFALSFPYTSSYSNGGSSNGNCAGSLLESPSGDLVTLTCRDSAIGFFALKLERGIPKPIPAKPAAKP